MNSLEDDQLVPPLILYSRRLSADAFTLIVPVLTAQVGCITNGWPIDMLPFTKTVAVTGLPVQPLIFGVMVKTTGKSLPSALVNVPLILPVPLAAIPMTVPLLTSPKFLVQL